MNLHFDWTINIPTILAAVAWLITMLKLWLYQRDFNRDILTILGKRTPRDDRSGLLGDVATLQEDYEVAMALVEQHHQHLGLDRRHHQRRHTRGAEG